MTTEGALQIEINDEAGGLPAWVAPGADTWWGCDTCGARIDGGDNRSVRRYCSNACRQKAYRERTGRR